MAGKSVAERPAAQVPALVQTPALQITAEDISLPRLSIGQYMSSAVKEQLVKAGDIFSSTGQDDPDPNILWEVGSDKPGPTFYVIALIKKRSYTDKDTPLTLYDFDDPNAPADAWVTYNYTITIPAEDPDVPYKLLLTRTGRPAALQINTVLKKNSITGPAWLNAFQITSAVRESPKGKWFVPRVTQVPTEATAVEVAQTLAIQMSSSVVEHSATGEEPTI